MNKQLVNKFFESLKQGDLFSNEQSPTPQPNAENFFKTLESDQAFINNKIGGEE